MEYDAKQIGEMMQTYMRIGQSYDQLEDWLEGRQKWPGKKEVEDYAEDDATYWIGCGKEIIPEEIRELPYIKLRIEGLENLIKQARLL